MLSLNAIGNLGADAEVRTANGRQFISFKIAHSESWTGDDGTKHESTTWISCIINNTNSPVLPYLKRGVKVFVQGRFQPKVYSSPTRKMMVAGIDCSVDRIELCGGSSDPVPRRLVTPDGILVEVSKYYWTKQPAKKYTELFSERGGRYLIDENGFIIPDNTSPEAQTTTEEETQQQADENN